MRDSKKELLAEMLLIQDDAPHDLKTRTRMGPESRGGLPPADYFGESYAMPPYADARRARREAEFIEATIARRSGHFQSTLRLEPEDHVTAPRRLQRAAMLDPTILRLRSESISKLVELAWTRPTDRSKSIAGVGELLDKAGKALKAHACQRRPTK